MAFGGPTVVGTVRGGSGASIVVPITSSVPQSNPTVASWIFVVVQAVVADPDAIIVSSITDDSGGGSGYSGSPNISNLSFGSSYLAPTGSNVPDTGSDNGGLAVYPYLALNPLTGGNNLTVTFATAVAWVNVDLVAITGIGNDADASIWGCSNYQLSRGSFPGPYSWLLTSGAGGASWTSDACDVGQIPANGSGKLCFACNIFSGLGSLPTWLDGAVTTVDSWLDDGAYSATTMIGWADLTPPLVCPDLGVVYEFGVSPPGGAPDGGESAFGYIFVEGPGPVYCTPPVLASPVFNHRFRAGD